MKHYLLSLILFLLCLTASARDVTYTYQGQTLTYTILDEETKTCKLTTNNAVTGEVVIPSEIKNGQDSYIVTEIGKSAFSNCSGLTAVTIPNSVTTIGKYSFYGCNGLTDITIPNSVNNIGRMAFSGCSGLTVVNIQDVAAWCNIKFEEFNANPLGDAHNLYLNGKKITELVIPGGVSTIGEWAFYCCSGLTSVTIPNSVTTIDESAFFGCDGLVSVTIPNGVTTIGYHAFENCSSLISVSIPNSVTTIGAAAFMDCSGLTSVTIPNSVTTIDDATFHNCRKLTSVIIPKNVTTIGESAFYGCRGLTSIIIPNSATTIGESAFEGCSSLTSVYSLNSIPPSIFSHSFYHEQRYATLYVPDDALEAYRTADVWKNFMNIQGIEATGMTNINADGQSQQSIYYDLNGRKLNAPVKGVNIINGKKVMVM